MVKEVDSPEPFKHHFPQAANPRRPFAGSPGTGTQSMIDAYQRAQARYGGPGSGMMDGNQALNLQLPVGPPKLR